MTTRDHLDMARKVAQIRALQLERTRAEAQRLACGLNEAQAREHEAVDNLNAHAQGLRQALEHPGALSPDLLQNWAGAVAAARDAQSLAAQQTQAAAQQVEAFRPTLGQHQRRSEVADELADRARRRYERACDEAHAATIEDLFLSHGSHGVRS